MKKLMQPFKVGEDVGLFLVNFERTCEKLSFAPETWPQRLLTLLPCEAAEVVARLSAGDADDYDKVKSSLLKRYRLSAEAFRQRFRNAPKKSSEGYSEFAYGLKTNLTEWLKSEEVYESRDKVIAATAKSWKSCRLWTFPRERAYIRSGTDGTDGAAVRCGLVLLVRSASKHHVTDVFVRELSAPAFGMQLPQLPDGKRLETTVFLQGDLRGRPYRTQDFAEALEESVGMKHVVGLGTFQYNHVLICTLDTAEAKERLAAFKELTVKGRRCVIIDPNQTEVTLRVHWLPTFVTDSEVEGALASLGRLKPSTREKWRAPNGAYEVHSTTRSLTLVLCEGVNKENLPHQASIAGYPVLLSMPGRPPLCLRCNQLGHTRRQCQAPCQSRVQVHAAPEDVLLDDGDEAMQLAFTEPLPPLDADDTSRDSGEHPEVTEGECDIKEDNEKVAQIDDVVQLTDGLAASAEATGSTPASKLAAPSAEAATPCKSLQPSGPGAAEQPNVIRQSQRQKPKKPDNPPYNGD
ncbi:hypothetical protein HPB47_014367 [Ixodes persulcatus]|uniref:Uncharacterized protein n=1 Tax=Ixodes persulcatus TaxID=34615 RepID=A0AC60QZS8_IXOPE|nr:hypothetical protein HPB47_014367 [Ixodes persulcatus]